MVEHGKNKNGKKQIQDIYSLTSLQEGMLFYNIVEERTTNYVVQTVYEIFGDLQVDNVKSAIEILNQRYDVLRTQILYKKLSKPRQVVLEKKETEFQVVDISYLPEEEQPERFAEIERNDVDRGFDFDKDSLIRFILVKFSEKHYKMIWNCHHIIIDGWSLSHLYNSFIEYYSELSHGKSFLQLQTEIETERKRSKEYKNYISWLEHQNMSAGLKYWENLLADYENETKIEPSRVPERDYDQTSFCEKHMFSQEITKKITSFAVENKISVNTVMESAIGILLQKYNRSEDIVFGKVVSGRNADIVGIEEIVGLLINTIPVRIRTSKKMTVQEYLRDVQEQATNSGVFDYCPLSEIQNRTVMKNGLVHIVYAFENYYNNSDSLAGESGLSVRVASSREETNYAITITAGMEDNQLGIKLMYNPNEYVPEDIRRVISHLECILMEMAVRKKNLISEVSEISEEEKNIILSDFNDTDRAYESEKTIAELFDSQAKAHPDRTAVIYNGQKVTYGSLCEMADRIAGRLVDMGVEPDDAVAVMSEKSIEVIAGILGILKAGGAYVPVDPDYPAERIRYMLKDCRPKAVLYYKEKEETGLPSVSLAEAAADTGQKWDGISRGGAGNLAYIIYTSGTTGKPKGSLIENRSVVRLVRNTNFMKLDSHTCMLQTGSLSFDASTLEIWGTLLNGGTLVLADREDIMDMEALCGKIEENGVNAMWLTSTLFNQMIQGNEGMFDGLEYLLIGGEKLSEHHVRLMKERGNGVRLINGYGPTENTTFTTTYEIPEGFRSIPIGKPVANTQVYVMNGEELCGIGIPGELCTAGDGVARGYLNQPGLTAEKFTKNPYGEGMIYHSGDLVRWMEDGNLEYLGRIDDQVKIRGFRIEPGEIETVLRNIEGITGSAVIIRTDGNQEKSIHAYFTSDVQVELSALRERMKEELPDYMVPAYMMQIERIPVTMNGKLDRAALPVIESGVQNAYTAPKTETERLLCRIYEEITGTRQVGIRDSFFEIGGHSLRATRLANRIEKELGVHVPLKEIFRHPAVEELAGIVEKGKNPKEKENSIPKAEEKEFYAMSSAQKRSYLLWQMDVESVSYNIPQCYAVDGEVDRRRLEETLQKMVDRHEILRTRFMMAGNEPVQKIEKEFPVKLFYLEDAHTDIKELNRDFVKPFDLEKGPLIRMELVKRENGYLLLLDMHHIISDGMSMGTFMREFSVLYSGGTLLEPERQFKDYSEWMQTRDLGEQEKYWLGVFEDEIPVLDLPLDYQRPQIQSDRGSMEFKELDQELGSGIRRLAKETGTTEYMVFMSAAMILLGKYGRQEDVVIGTPISGRTHRDTEGMLGMFVNTLAVRTQPEGEKPYSRYLEEVRDICLKAYENQEYPYEELVERAGVRRDASRNPLFDVLLVLQNNEEEELKLGDTAARYLIEESGIAKFDLSFNIGCSKETYVVALEYCTDLFTKETAGYILTHYMEILRQIVFEPEKRISEIETAGLEEKAQIINTFNASEADYPKGKTVVELFEEQVLRTPERVAVVCSGEELTYEELNRRANAVALRLREMGVGRNDFVALLTQRSLDMIAAIYGVLKAGGAYVPIDPSYPRDRIEYTIEDCRPKAVITYGAELGMEVPVLDLADRGAFLSAPKNQIPNPAKVNGPDDVAYVIYTSGTTGRPKGVMVTHRNVVRLFVNEGFQYDFNEKDVWMMFHSYCFDFSVWEMYGATLFGGKLVVLTREEAQDTYLTVKCIETHGVTILNQVPSAFYNLMRVDRNNMGSVRCLIFGGEALQPDKLKEFHKKYPDAGIVNMYGITETTVHVTYREIGDEQIERGISDIGSAIPTLGVYIMDGNHMCGIGIPGELCVTGAGVAKGYLNRPELTEEKFVPNPFGEGRMYRSGDLARWMPDGNIEYMGRIDQQVKIRGFRIELGEIESVIRKQQAIEDSVVIVREDKGDKVLCAYIVTGDGQLSIQDLKAAIRKDLPEYMIPSYFMQIEKIPVTRNGKLDKKALPEIEVTGSGEYLAPRNETESMLCRLFGEILEIEKVSVRDSFFDLGGHSLRAIRLINRMEEELGVRIPLKELFTHTTVEELAEVLSENGIREYEGIPKAEEKESYAMSSAQRRIYLIQCMTPESTTYNMPQCMRLRGNVDAGAVKKALDFMVERHEILRTCFCMENGEPVQKIQEGMEAEFCCVEADGRDAESLMHEFVRPFDLEKGPLVRMMLAEGREESLLLIDMHHIVSDGMSINTFIREFSEVYNGKEPAAPARQYRDYSEWMRKRSLEEQKNYWISEFSDEVPVLDMPTDYKRPQEQSYRGSVVHVKTGTELGRKIKLLIQRTEVTDYMLFLSAAMAMLGRYGRQEDVVIGTVISGRTHKDTEGMMGMFVNTLAMRGKPENRKRFEDFLGEVKESCLRAYENQEYPFEELVEEIHVKRDLSRNPLFDVMLVMQNNEAAELEFDGIEAEPVEAEGCIAKFDLTFNIVEEKGEYGILLEYCSDLFEERSVQRLLEHYVRLLEEITEDAAVEIGRLSMLTEEEREQVITVFNDTDRAYESEKTIAELFDSQAKAHPDRTAVIYKERQVTYRELNRMADVISQYLRQQGIRPGDYVCLFAKRGIEMVAGVYGIMKSGAAYVPIDPTYPTERIRFMLEDCCPKMVLTYGADLDTDIPVLDLGNQRIYEAEPETWNCVNQVDDIAYVIYTSGTTGEPKGVMVGNRGIANLKQAFDVTEADRVLQFANFIFDASILEFTMALLNGATLVIMPEGTAGSTKDFETFFREQKITVTLLPPNYYSQVLEIEPRVLITGGSEAGKYIVENCRAECYINAYGPTEITVCSTSWYRKEGIPHNGVIPIGKPICNMKNYVMNGDVLCGIGMPGELCIGGVGVSAGYLNRNELTCEKFIKNPFGEGMMYRSGDLVRWNESGNLEYLGRIDQQVKVRGYRIELGEIETVLRNMEEIVDAAVITRKDMQGENIVYAYYVTDKEITVPDIRTGLAKKLPEYMIPSLFMELEQIPVTRSGKVDRLALPEIEAIGGGYVAPVTKNQKVLCHIFEEILGIEHIGISESFFELGGHSLRATRLINQVEAELGIRIPLKQVFTTPTVEGLSGYIESSREEEYVPIPKAEEKESYAMSSAQKRIYLIQEMDRESLAYNMPQMLRFDGGVTPEVLREALQEMMNRHEILRTSFLVKDGETVQQVLPFVKADFEYKEDLVSSEKELMERFVKPFDLNHPPLVRMCVVKREKDYAVMLDMHHIVGDGDSEAVFMKEFNALCRRETLEPLTHQYKDYSEWMLARDLRPQEKYWLELYNDEVPVLDMPLDYKRPQEQSYRGGIIMQTTDGQLHENIRKLAREYRATEFMVFTAAAMVMLSKYSRQEDIVIGTPISGRTHHDTEHMLGMFVNTLALRGKPEKEKNFGTFLEEVREHCLKAYENQEYPFEELVEKVDVARDLSRNPMFDVMLSFHNNEMEELELLGSGALQEESVTEADSDSAKFDLSFDVIEKDGAYVIVLEYVKALYKKDAAENMLKHMICIMEQITREPGIQLKDIRMLTAGEEEQIRKANATERKDETRDTIVSMFEKQAECAKDRIALRYQGKTITYEEFNRRVNAVAYRLREMGVGTNDFVGIAAKQGIEMIVGIYGILKSGAAYVPIDVNYPEDRIHYIIQDCRPKALLVYQTEITAECDIVDLGEVKVSKRDHMNPEMINVEGDAAYVIYTSGTTGKPKGVVITHGNLANYVKAFSEYMEVNESDVVLQQASIGFDTSVEELYPALVCGGSVAVLEREKGIDLDILEHTIREQGVTLISASPLLLNELNRMERLESVSRFISGGDSLKYEYIDQLVRYADVYNTYGPTEATVCATYHKVTEAEESVSIGRPIRNCRVYIMEDGNLCGIGQPGELCIAGAGVTRGYLNQPELTKAVFTKCPYETGKMYHTGDLARWMPDGNIEYMGRIDQQVKIRGFRIEPGEIETVLRTMDGIENAAVVARENAAGEKALYAYIVSGEKQDLLSVRNHLKETLPEYMIPSYMAQIDSIPVNQNGKLDSRKLPEITVHLEQKYVEPQNEQQEALCRIFAEVLGTKRVGIRDDFFELGGHSLRATRLINQVEAELGIHIPLKQVFTTPTVEGLSGYIESSRKEEYVPIPKAEEKESYAMSSAQKRIYLIQEMDRESLAYNMPQAIELHGEIEAAQIQSALQEMIHRHEILRTSFLMENGKTIQKILPDAEAEFEYIEDAESNESDLIKSFVRPFDLSKPPLVRGCLIKREEGYLFLLDMHHIVGDGGSDAVFMKEFNALCRKETLEPLALQYKDYSEWMLTRDFSHQKEYWVQRFADEIPVLNMPTDFARPQEQSFDGRTEIVTTKEALGKKLEQYVQRTATTDYMLFLSALMVTLGKYSRQEDIVIGSPISGRTHGDIENMLGMFANTLAMRGKPEKDKTFQEFLLEMKENCLKAYENQEFPFEELVESVDVVRDMSRNPLFDVMLTMQNNETEVIQVNDSKVEYHNVDMTIAKFDLNFSVTKIQGNYVIVMEYCTALYTEETAKGILEHLLEVLRQIVEHPEKKIGEIELLTEAERKLIDEEFNDTDTEYDRSRTVVDLFEEQVKNNPDKTALEFCDKSMTYQELDHRANLLAYRLREMGVKPNDFVAVMADRSIEMIVGIFGIIKSGGAYVPIDPGLPQARIEYILNDCQAKVTVVYGEQAEKVFSRYIQEYNGNAPESVNLKDDIDWSLHVNTPVKVNKPEDLAYMIYTSGTTGNPKGVMIEHGGVLNLRENCIYDFKVTAQDKILLFANITFDASVGEITMALLMGGTLCIPDPERMNDVEYIEECIEEKQLTIMAFPTHFAMLLNYSDANFYLTAGSEANREAVARIVEKSDFMNSYGPTETTVCATYWRLPKGEPVPEKIPIGKPHKNTRIYIMDGEVQCGIGVPGELCIVRHGVARGYLNRPELTDEKFVPNPFGEGKMYRSGDLARWMPDGNIEYMGRIDQQVKIRGFRIELGEIESVLRGMEDIRDAAVIARNDASGIKAIYGYIVSDKQVDIWEIRNELGTKLPDYMVPAYMMQIDAIPMTKNGKLDKKALPEIESQNSVEYVAPTNTMEELLCGIFAEILGVEKIGICDSFYAMGGDSIKAIRIVSKAREAGIELSVKDVMKQKTVQDIAFTAKQLEKTSYEQGIVTGIVESTPIIRSFDRLALKKPWHFNQTEMFKLPNVDELQLRHGLTELVRHHDILRAVYRDNRLEIRGMEESLYDLEIITLMDEDAAEKVEAECNRIQASIDLERGPLMKAAVFVTKQGSYMMMCLHHLVVDGVSWRILIEDFTNIMKQLEREEEVSLPAKTASFKEWGEALKEYQESDMLKAEIPYWHTVAQEMGAGRIPEQKSEDTGTGAIYFGLDETDTDRLLTQSSTAFNTEINDLLLAAIGMAFRQVSGQERVTVGLEGHGREEIHKKIDIDRTVGWFTCMYPVIIRCLDDAEDSIVETKEMLRKVPNHGIGFGILEDEIGEIKADLYFNYLGIFDAEASKEERIAFSTGMSSAKENKMPGSINFNGSVSYGRLAFEIMYDKSKYTEEFMHKLAMAYEKALKDIIVCCVSKEESSVTISDTYASDLGDNDLDFINSLF